MNLSSRIIELFLLLRKLVKKMVKQRERKEMGVIMVFDHGTQGKNLKL